MGEHSASDTTASETTASETTASETTASETTASEPPETARSEKRRPSDDLDELRGQLLRELERLDGAGDEIEEPLRYRDYLRYAQAVAWERVYKGDAAAPRQVLDRLRAGRWFVDAHLPTLSPKAWAAVDVHLTLHSLYLAEDLLGGAAEETRLSDRRRSPTEREVLRVLARSGGEFLRRGEVHERLNLVERPSAPRVGQILADLYHHHLVLRVQRQAQGGAAVSFYALSPRGHGFCRRLGLEREDRRFFDFSPELQSRFLKPELLATRRNLILPRPGAVTAFFAHRGGVGRSTMVALMAPLLASRLGAAGKNVLVIDFDLDAPGLDSHLAPTGLGVCRGLRGLMYDFHQKAASRRSAWLEEALTEPQYVLRPRDNLVYLPSGFAPGVDRQAEEERAEVLSRLHGEAGIDDSGTPGEGFLHTLAATLRKVYERTLIDPSSGLGLGAWAATQVLADELVLCGRLDDDEAAGFRIVMSNFLKRREERWQDSSGESRARVGFVFSFIGAAENGDANAWIGTHVMGAENFDTYRTFVVLFDESSPYRDDRYAGLVDYFLEGQTESPWNPWWPIGNSESRRAAPAPAIVERMYYALSRENPKDRDRRIVEGLLMGCGSPDEVLSTVGSIFRVGRSQGKAPPPDLISRVGRLIDIKRSQKVRVFT